MPVRVPVHAPVQAMLVQFREIRSNFVPLRKNKSPERCKARRQTTAVDSRHFSAHALTMVRASRSTDQGAFRRFAACPLAAIMVPRMSTNY